jgi:transposase
VTHEQFLDLFPDDEACFEYLKGRYYPDGSACPSCGRVSKFHRIRGRSAYSCQFCGTHVYPTAGTIFHRTTTSLQLWFWAVLLMSSTQCTISTRQLERELGVTYKTAHRMASQIRALLIPEPAVASDAPADESGAAQTADKTVDRELTRTAPPPMNLRRRLRLSERT